MRRPVLPLVTLALAFKSVLACAGAETPKPPEPPPAPFDQLDFEGKKAFMRDKVLPAMRPLFQSYDATFFAEVDCTTCHGLDAEERDFEMPNGDILALYPTGHPKQVELVQKQPDMLRFMFNKVVPTMRDLLGRQPYDVKSGTGFSCFACHPRGDAN